MFGQLFRGEYTVAQTYWFGFVAVNFALRLFTVALAALQIPLIVRGLDWLIPWIYGSVSVAAAVYFALLARGLYRSMYRHRRPSFWSWIGLVMIVLGFLGALYSLAALVADNLPMTKRALTQEVIGTNMSLPVEISPGIMAERVTFEDGVFRTEYSYAHDDLEEGRLNLFETGMAAETCAEMEGYFRGPVEVVEFAYIGASATSTVYITRDDCLAHLDSGG